MAGKVGGDDEDIIVDINVTPLVDVVLVLLIIFMVTARLLIPPAIPVELPKASTGEEGKSSPLAISIKRATGEQSEAYYLNGKPISTTQLPQELEQFIKKEGKKKIQAIIAADQLVPHGKVIWVLDTLRRLGVEQYAFNIDPDAAKP